MKTLSSVIERLSCQGFTAHCGVVGNRLRAFESGKTFGGHEVVIREYYRFEGVSDPDDMATSAFLKDVPIRRPVQPGAAGSGL